MKRLGIGLAAIVLAMTSGCVTFKKPLQYTPNQAIVEPHNYDSKLNSNLVKEQVYGLKQTK